MVGFAPPVFQMADVHYAYHGIPALTGLTLAIPRGQRVALLGANGSGKSTLLRLLDGLYFAQSGRVAAFGQMLTEAALQDEDTAIAFRRRVGLVFQNPDVQLFNPTVLDEVAFGPLQMGWPRDEVMTRVARALEEFGLTALKDRPPHRLSGGEKKRVALASVLVLEPEALLLDEPTAALDPKSASDMVDFLIRCQGTGRTVITATHDLDIVADIADLCVVMKAGRVVAQGAPRAILNDAALMTDAHLAHTHLHIHHGHMHHSHHHLHSDTEDPPG
ncbi:MAG: ATP-binding cassette domain-containing protein [Rhodobacteraceae bacterium]|nr:ATP-binding cassette domain-containing protein [Paracoccaceae bacterium]